MIAQDIMNTNFQTLRPENTLAEAIKLFIKAGEAAKRRIFGLMVTDEQERLVGMLSMYDILMFIKPKHVHIWGEMDDLEPYGLFVKILDRVKSIQVSDIMTTDVVTIQPETHVMVILDLMIRKHIRRLPVIDGNEVVGIVYVSDLFNYLLRQFLV